MGGFIKELAFKFGGMLLDRISNLFSREFLLPLTALVLAYLVVHTGKVVLDTTEKWVAYLSGTVTVAFVYVGGRILKDKFWNGNNKKEDK